MQDCASADGLFHEFGVAEAQRPGILTQEIEEFDILVKSRGGYRLRDHLKMVVRTLPLSRGEINILFYAPIPVLLVEGERG